MTTPGGTSPSRSADNEPDPIMFGPHVVALVDFLGQAADLARWDCLPGTQEEEARFLDAVRGTFGRIMHWRERFVEDIDRWCTPRPIPAWVVDPDPQEVEAYQRFQELSLKVMHFSDTIVLHAPIENRHGFLQVAGICAMVVKCGVRMPLALAEKTVFRGAIEIGMAAQFPQTDLYGPALAKVHYLESKVAQYPRIVVRSTLVSYLQAHVRNSDASPPARANRAAGQFCPARANRAAAKFCLDRLAQDEDKEWIVDYLGEPFASSGRGRDPAKWNELTGKALSFVMSELERFKRAGNVELSGRYKRLVAYFASRGFVIPNPS